MDNKKELLPVLQDLAECGRKMTAFAELMMKTMTAEVPEPQTDEAPAPEPAAPAPEEAPKPTYTFQEVRRAFAAKSHAGHTDAVRALIGKYGAERLSEVKEADYAALMADLEVIG